MAADGKDDTAASTTTVAAPSQPGDTPAAAGFAAHDYVVYSGSLGTYRGRVAGADGPRHFVDLEGVGRLLCGAEDLTADAEGLLGAAGA